MTYHDRKLVPATKRCRAGRVRVWRSAMQGISEISLSPSIPRFEFGCQADDWRAVGDDIRTAMERVRLGE